MKGITLTLDLGNSAAKLARWSDSVQSARVEWDASWRATLAEYLRPDGEDRVGLVAISSVVAKERLEEVVSLCEAPGREVLVNPDSPLRIACRDSHTIGRDRLFAALGAWDLHRSAAIVVDAGTALTVDALGEEAGRGVFLGGAITPGPSLLARALGDGGANLFEVQAGADVPALGQDTAEALAAGVRIGFRGAALELVRRVGEQAGLDRAPVCLTGGAWRDLSSPGLFGDRVVQHSPLLVHHGLRSAVGLERSPR